MRRYGLHRDRVGDQALSAQSLVACGGGPWANSARPLLNGLVSRGLIDPISGPGKAPSLLPRGRRAEAPRPARRRAAAPLSPPRRHRRVCSRLAGRRPAPDPPAPVRAHGRRQPLLRAPGRRRDRAASRPPLKDCGPGPKYGVALSLNFIPRSQSQSESPIEVSS